MPSTVHRCQWPDCPAIAMHFAHRGERAMPVIALCTRHLLAFRELPDPEALRLSAQRQAPHRRQVNHYSEWAWVQANRAGG